MDARMNYQIFDVRTFLSEDPDVDDFTELDIVFEDSLAALHERLREESHGFPESKACADLSAILSRALASSPYVGSYELDLDEIWLDENSFAKHYVLLRFESAKPISDRRLMLLFYGILSRYFGNDGQCIYGGPEEDSFYELGYSIL